jgi:hypothetical protein
MEGRPSREDALAMVQGVMNRLENAKAGGLKDHELVRHLFETGVMLMTSSYALLAMSSLGECRKQTPYAALKPVIDANGNFKWCCEHTTEHCA